MKIFVGNVCKNFTQTSPVPKSLYLTVGKVKEILVQAWRGLEGSMRVRLPDFKAIDV